MYRFLAKLANLEIIGLEIDMFRRSEHFILPNHRLIQLSLRVSGEESL